MSAPRAQRIAARAGAEWSAWRRPRRARPGLGLVGAILGALLLPLVAPAAARADGVAGALSGQLLVADGDVGGGVGLDLWAPLGWLRLGGYLGVAAVPSERDGSNRLLTPLSLSVGAHAELTPELSLSVRLRAGGWAGATQAEKLTGGAFFGGGLHLGLSLGGGVHATLGLDVSGIIASDAWKDASMDEGVSASTWVLAPTLGLSWTPEGTP